MPCGLDGGAEAGGRPLEVWWLVEVGAGANLGAPVAPRGLGAGKRKVPLLVFWFRLVSVRRGSVAMVPGFVLLALDTCASLSLSCCTS